MCYRLTLRLKLGVNHLEQLEGNNYLGRGSDKYKHKMYRKLYIGILFRNFVLFWSNFVSLDPEHARQALYH